MDPILANQIDRFAAGPDVLARAAEGLSPADLDARPVPGTWSIREIVAHLYDSDMVGCDRMRRVAAMDNPLLMGYDQDRFVERLGYKNVDVGAAVSAFAANRGMLVAVLRSLPDEAYARAGIHSERGRETLEHLVKGYCDHLDHHLGFLRKKRALLAR
jgi:hypothetical protein